MLKAEFHIHINEDPQDYWIRYDIFKLIDDAIIKKYDILAITCHNYYYYNKKAYDYANKRGILLLFGIEKTVSKAHVLIINANKQSENINNLNDLIKYKANNKDCLIIAPHPFYFFHSIGFKIIKNIDLFDAWEYSYFNTKFFNIPNKLVMYLSKKYCKPVLGNSDVHNIKFLGKTYSIIDAKKNIKSIFKAIKENKIKIVSKPLSLTLFTKIFLKSLRSIMHKKIRKLINK